MLLAGFIIRIKERIILSFQASVCWHFVTRSVRPVIAKLQTLKHLSIIKYKTWNSSPSLCDLNSALKSRGRKMTIFNDK